MAQDKLLWSVIELCMALSSVLYPKQPMDGRPLQALSSNHVLLYESPADLTFRYLQGQAAASPG